LSGHLALQIAWKKTVNLPLILSKLLSFSDQVIGVIYARKIGNAMSKLARPAQAAL
jgi:hypothetical protein